MIYNYLKKGGQNMSYKAIKTKLYLSQNEKKFLLFLMHEAKNLYNQALYNVRQHYFDTGQYLDYVENYKLLKDNTHYRTLSTSLAQSVIRKVDEAMKAFFGSIKSKKSKKVKLPRYLDKDAYYSLVDRMVYKANKHEYTLPRGKFIKRLSKQFEEISNKLIKKNLFLSEIESLTLKIETPKCITNKKIKEITIKEKYDGKYIEVIHVYEDDEEKENDDSMKTETMGIDFGYNNLAMCALTNGHHLLIDGLRLKSMNQRYWKKISRLASLRENQQILTKRMIGLMEKRNNQMTYGINKAAKLMIEHAKKEKVKEIIIGYNEGFKDIKSNKRNHQWFKAIPIARLRDRIILLAKANDIECQVINEAYTSKASFIDKDDFNQIDYSGKRIKRGLYQSKKGTLINADLNASLNMIRKCKPNALGTGFKGWNTPKRTYLFS